jgi:hypothetical protein
MTDETRPSHEFFVWTQMEAEGGEELLRIIQRKESERMAGGGVFWWCVGNSISAEALRKHADKTGTLSVVFSQKPTCAQEKGRNPSEICVWSCYEDNRTLPPHVLVTSGPSKREYALVCQSAESVTIRKQPFDDSLVQTYMGNSFHTKRVTQLVRRPIGAKQNGGNYDAGFSATLIQPWVVRLARPRVLTPNERGVLLGWKPGDDWMSLVRRLRM